MKQNKLQGIFSLPSYSNFIFNSLKKGKKEDEQQNCMIYIQHKKMDFDFVIKNLSNKLMACCDTRSVVVSLFVGLLFWFVIADQFRYSDPDIYVVLIILGWILVTYGGFGCLYQICICIGCCRQHPQPAYAIQRQPPPAYANNIRQPIIYQPPNNNNYQPINSSNLINQIRPQRQDHFIRQTYNQNQCTICLDYFQLNEFVARLQCGHKFHQNCITDWARKQTNCPVCRTPIQ